MAMTKPDKRKAWDAEKDILNKTAGGKLLVKKLEDSKSKWCLHLSEFESPSELHEKIGERVKYYMNTYPNYFSREDRKALRNGYYKVTVNPLDFQSMLDKKEINMGEGLTPERREELADQYNLSDADFDRFFKEARINWNKAKQAEVPEQIKQARQEALHGDSGGWVGIPGTKIGVEMPNLPGDQTISEILLPRAYESAENRIETGSAPEEDYWALTGDVADIATSFVPGPSGALKGLKFMKALENGGKAKRAANIAINVGADAVKDLAGTAAAEGVAGQSDSYDFSGANVVGSGLGSLTTPMLAGGASALLNQVPATRRVAEAVERASKTFSDSPALQKMQFDGDVAALKEMFAKADNLKKQINGLPQELRGSLKHRELQMELAKQNKINEDFATEFTHKYPTLFTKTEADKATEAAMAERLRAPQVQPVLTKKGNVNSQATKWKQTGADNKAKKTAKEQAQMDYPETPNERAKLLTDETIELPNGEQHKVKRIETLNANKAADRVNEEALYYGNPNNADKGTWNPTREEAGLVEMPDAPKGKVEQVVQSVMAPASRIYGEQKEGELIEGHDEHQKKVQERMKKPKEVKLLVDDDEIIIESDDDYYDERDKKMFPRRNEGVSLIAVPHK